MCPFLILHRIPLLGQNNETGWLVFNPTSPWQMMQEMFPIKNRQYTTSNIIDKDVWVVQNGRVVAPLQIRLYKQLMKVILTILEVHSSGTIADVGFPNFDQNGVVTANKSITISS